MKLSFDYNEAYWDCFTPVGIRNDVVFHRVSLQHSKWGKIGSWIIQVKRMVYLEEEWLITSTCRLSLDLYLSPVFLWIVFFLMHLSMTEKVSGRSFRASSSFLFLMASLSFFICVRRADLFFVLIAALRMFRLHCLIADLWLGIFFSWIEKV